MRRAFSFANVCSFLALTIALGTGGAYAANTVFSTDIVDGEVKSADLATNAVTSTKINNGSVLSAELGTNAVTAKKIAADAVTSAHVLPFTLLGADVAPNTLTGANVDESSLAKVPDADKVDGLDSSVLIGARASGRVDPATCAATAPFACTVFEGKGITSTVTRPDEGSYCITVPGINATSTVLGVTVDGATSANSTSASSWEQSNPVCADSAFAVAAKRAPTAEVASPNGGGTNVPGIPGLSNEVGFTFIVP